MGAKLRVILTTSVIASAALLLVVVQEQEEKEAYAQWVATFDEIDEDNQPLIEEIANKALNQTADHISIFEDGGKDRVTFTER